MDKIIKFINKNKIYIACLVIVLISGISIYIQKKDRENSININKQAISSKTGKIAVYITGAVKNPGVYYLEENSRMNALLDVCGGVLTNADINKLNLAQKLIDSDKITVPIKVEESENSLAEDVLSNDNENSEKININTANKNELMELNGVGESTANKIIEYRKTTAFIEIEDIMNVPGIGESKFENMKNSICTE